VNGGLDDLELEVRRIPGVVAVGLRRADRLVVQVAVAAGADPAGVAERARMLALAYDADPVVEVQPLAPPEPAPGT
jgi:phage terminase large subunit-like protein